MKDNKPNNSKLIQTYLSKKTLRYGTASALTLALYLFNSNVTVYADENTANQNQGTSQKLHRQHLQIILKIQMPQP